MTAVFNICQFRTNPLLKRKQFNVKVIHPDRANVSKSEIREHLMKLFKVADSKCIVLYGFRTTFGGGRSSGMGLIYDSLSAVEAYEKKYRLVRMEIEAKVDRKARRGRKELKNKKKKVHGKSKAKVSSGKK